MYTLSAVKIWYLVWGVPLYAKSGVKVVRLKSNLRNSACSASSFKELQISGTLSIVKVKCIFDKR